MAKVKIQANGVKALQERLNKRRETIVNALKVELSQLAEAAVTYSKDVKGYRDRTANLKNSISFALYLDGELLTSKVGEIPKPKQAARGQEGIAQALSEYAAKDGVVSPNGFSLVIVAGMDYGRYVEDKGYNVLHLTKYYLRDEMRKILEKVIERINKGEV